MKKFLFSLFTLSIISVSCTEQVQINDVAIVDDVFTTGFESNNTRIYIDEEFNLYWNKEDSISVFSNTYNQKYVFNGETGDNSGTFSRVNPNEFHTGSALSSHFSVYPYWEDTKIGYDGIITVNLPGVQSYRKDTFGEASNVMLAVTADVDDRFLFFKNVCGFLKIQLWGNIMVQKIELVGNDTERLSGTATIVGSHESDPVITMSETAFHSVVLQCSRTGIAIGASEENPTSFWFALPPTTFTKGITLIVTDVDGNEYTLTSEREQVVKRNVCLTLPAIKVSNGTLEDPVELESDSSVNCFVVSHSGYYKFSIGSYAADTAFLLWNENGESDITNVMLNDGYIYFKKNDFNEGNAVISIMSNDEIVWSWHIWSTDIPRDFDVNGTVWMDRNLGATSTIADDPGVYGLAYNPGNPFPFPGPKYDTYNITTTPSVPEGWYVAEGYGFYKSNDIPKPSQPMQLCSNDDAFGASSYFTRGYSQCPKGYYVTGYSSFQKMIGYEPVIEDNGVYPVDGMYIPCISYNRPSTTSGKYLCSGIYNTTAVDTYAVYFYDGISKMTYCQGAALMPVRCRKDNY